MEEKNSGRRHIKNDTPVLATGGVGLDDFHFRSLRHKFATDLFDHGATILKKGGESQPKS